MSTDFQMNYHHNKDNLHVKMQGIFDGNSAHELLNLFLREYRCGGRVFVDTAGVSEVLPFGSKVLQARLCQTPVPASQLFFKGENGFNMAPSGSRVLIVPQEEKRVLRKMRALHMPWRTRAWARRMRMSRRTQSRSLTFFQVELFHE